MVKQARVVKTYPKKRPTALKDTRVSGSPHIRKQAAEVKARNVTVKALSAPKTPPVGGGGGGGPIRTPENYRYSSPREPYEQRVTNKRGKYVKLRDQNVSPHNLRRNAPVNTIESPPPPTGSPVNIPPPVPLPRDTGPKDKSVIVTKKSKVVGTTQPGLTTKQAVNLADSYEQTRKKLKKKGPRVVRPTGGTTTDRSVSYTSPVFQPGVLNKRNKVVPLRNKNVSPRNMRERRESVGLMSTPQARRQVEAFGGNPNDLLQLLEERYRQYLDSVNIDPRRQRKR